jgi:hypothetical protein
MKAPCSWKLIFLPVLLSMNESCSIVDPASPTASYIRVDSFSLQTDYPNEGSNSTKITDAWVLVDNKYLGTIPLPAVIPAIGEGSHTVSIKAGILENGISASRAAYPKYASFDTVLSFTAGDTFHLHPVIRYAQGVYFPQLEDFDDANLTVQSTNVNYAPLVIIQQTDPDSYQGNSGKTTLDAMHTTFEIASTFPFPLPLNVPVYLELNYKCDVDFSIGVYITTTNSVIKNDLLSVRATPVWKKIYVTLSELGGVIPEGLEEKIYIHSDLGTTLTSANLFFDNLKVIY